MNPIIQAQLKRFKESNPGEELNDSEFFEVMSIFSIENGVLGENVDPFKIHLRGHEFGVDGVAISIQGALCTDMDEAMEVLALGKNHTAEFHFYQSKTSSSFNYGDLSKFFDAVYDFFTKQVLLAGEQIETLIDIKNEIYSIATKASPSLRCYYCTTGSEQVSDVIQNLLDTNKTKLSNLNIFNEVHIECVGAKVIQEGFRAATNSSTAKLDFPKSITMPHHDKIDEAYIGYVPASEVLSIALGEPDQEGNRHINRALFYDNVRDFNPESEINKAIISEIEKGDDASFVFKNNGITIVAKNIDRKGDTFTLEDYQIVNGCQTTNILALAREKAEKISVPLRLIGCSDGDFVSSIIIGTNRQNEVREDQFWAMLPFMKDLEEFCVAQGGSRRIYIERRDNQYRDVLVERTRVFRPSDLMKVAAAMFFYQPHRAARDHRGIRQEFSDKIFIDTHNIELYHLSVYSLYRFDYLIRSNKIDRARAIFRFYALCALVQRFWSSPDILKANKKNQKKIISSIFNIVDDNDLFAKHIVDVSETLEEMIAEMKITSREKIRDYIRSESVVEEFSRRQFCKNETERS